MKIIANTNDKDYGTKKGEVLEVTENDACQLEKEPTEHTVGCLFADPVVDGLIYFRHEDAPWSETSEELAYRLAWVWEQYVREDGFGECPGQKMIGSMMRVKCWKDFNGCIAGENYIAEVKDFFGFGCDGVSIQGMHTDQEICYVDNVVEVIRHFVLYER
jgi:hypothetical protein